MKNFHVPLSEETYDHLRIAAARSKVPATALAREAIDFWLRQQMRKARHDAIVAFAVDAAGTSLDLDDDLEATGIEQLVRTLRRRSEVRRCPLGRSGAAIRFRADGAPSRDCHLSRWLQSNFGLEVGYRSPDFNLSISEKARAHSHRDSGWRQADQRIGTLPAEILRQVELGLMAAMDLD
jgi:hypothetical protein